MMNTIIKNIYIFIFIIFTSSFCFSQNSSVKIALLKYNGGGDWYANPTSLKNLIIFCNDNLKTNIIKDHATVEVGSVDIFNYPFIHMTGHGNVVFSNQEAENLRNYLSSGGFLHIDDNYGLEPFVRREMKKVFPDLDFKELSFDEIIFHKKYNFNNGLPKIHEHDNKRPQAFGIFLKDKMVCLFTYECDLGDGWEDKEVHGDSDEIRLKALQMGANIVSYIFEY